MFATQLYTQIGLDSGSLTMLGTVMHPIAEPGVYRVTALRDGAFAGEIDVLVDADSGATQLDIDLASMGPGAVTGRSGCCGPATGPGVLRAGGYLVLRVATGDGGVSATVGRIELGRNTSKATPFDSRALGPDDHFAALVLRPGRYALDDTGSGSKGSLVVSYPEVGAKAKTTDAVVVSLAKGFAPKAVSVVPGQPVSFTGGRSSRVVITLEKPDDGPAEARPGRSRR